MATLMAAIGTAASSAASAVGSIFTGGAAAAGATSSTAAIGSAGAATSGTITLSQVLSAGSALAAIGQGIAANKQAQDQAAFAKTQALQEEAQGAARSASLAKEYAQMTGEQKVIQLANGLDIGIGSPVNIAEATKRQADRNLSVTRENARNRAAISRLRARGLLSEGRSALMSGVGQAAQIGADAYQLTG